MRATDVTSAVLVTSMVLLGLCLLWAFAAG